MRPWAVLFDLDGTLADTIPFLLRSMQHAFELMPEQQPSDAQWVAGIGTPLRSQLRQFVPNEDDVERLVKRYRAFQLEHHDALTKPFPEAKSVVSMLRDRGHPLAIVTSKGDELANRSLRHIGLAPFFDVVITAENVARHKPDPLPVLTALEKLNRPASEAVFIGDSTHDVHAGNGANVVSIAALWGPFTRAQLLPSHPKHFLEKLDALPALLEQLGASRAA